MLVTTPHSVIKDAGRPTVVSADASSCALDAALLQDHDWVLQPVAVFFQNFNWC